MTEVRGGACVESGDSRTHAHSHKKSMPLTPLFRSQFFLLKSNHPNSLIRRPHSLTIYPRQETIATVQDFVYMCRIKRHTSHCLCPYMYIDFFFFLKNCHVEEAFYFIFLATWQTLHTHNVFIDKCNNRNFLS